MESEAQQGICQVITPGNSIEMPIDLSSSIRRRHFSISKGCDHVHSLGIRPMRLWPVLPSIARLTGFFEGIGEAPEREGALEKRRGRGQAALRSACIVYIIEALRLFGFHGMLRAGA
jgi:hypothetical protein